MLTNINSALRAASPNAVQISNVDIDTIYRTGKFNAFAKYPRPVTVCFVRKGLKQHILNTKKSLGWDPNKKVAFLDDMTFEVRNHRETLKAIAMKAQSSDFVTKMAGNRILIDGASYGYKDMDLVPQELKSAIPMLKRVKNGIAFRGKDCYLSNFYPVAVKIDGETYNSAEQYFQYTKCVTCNDDDRAGKVLATNDPLRAKSIGDGCKQNEEWLEIRVFTLFKAQFHKRKTSHLP